MKGRPKGSKNYQIDRYSGVKLRQRIIENLNSMKPMGCTALYKALARNGQIPKKSNGEELDVYGFTRHFNNVKKDLGHTYSNFFIVFLHKCALNVYKSTEGYIPTSYSGVREISKLTGLLEITITDILILEGEIK